MPRNSNNYPFKNEAEEADWHASPEGRRTSERALRQSFAEGKVIVNDKRTLDKKTLDRAARTGSAIVNTKGQNVKRTDPAVLRELMDRVQAKQTKSISLRIPIGDIEAAKALGERAGIGYQTVLKQIIGKGLRSAR